MLQMVQNIDVSILMYIQDNIRCGFLDAVMLFFTFIGNGGAVWLILSAILMSTKKYRHFGFSLFFSVAVCWILNDVLIKNIVLRPRPFLAMDNLNVLVTFPSSFSFPSGHTTSSFAAAYVITKRMGKRGAWIYIVAVLIASSRIYVGVHYPSDIIAGALIGTIGSMYAYRFRTRFITFSKE